MDIEAFRASLTAAEPPPTLSARPARALARRAGELGRRA